MSKKPYTAIQAKVINHSVKSLREWGYPDCNSDNIFTDVLYSGFFLQDINNLTYEAQEVGASAIVAELEELKKDIKPDTTPNQ